MTTNRLNCLKTIFVKLLFTYKHPALQHFRLHFCVLDNKLNDLPISYATYN